jgi:hypothetical protein
LPRRSSAKQLHHARITWTRYEFEQPPIRRACRCNFPPARVGSRPSLSRIHAPHRPVRRRACPSCHMVG